MEKLDAELETIEYQPSFSVPIGPVEYNLNDIMPFDSLLLLESPILVDTITQLITYNDSLIRINASELYEVSLVEEIYFKDLEDFSKNLDRLVFRTNCLNENPLEMNIQISFLSSNSDLLARLFSEKPISIPPATLHEDGSITPGISQTDTPLSRQMIDILIEAHLIQIDISIAVRSSDLEVLHLFSDHKLKLQFGVRADLDIPLSLD